MHRTTPPTLDDLLTHAGFVRSVARAAVRGDADVDDVVQATWLAALEKGPRHGGSPRGWLATVARNAARGLGRGADRRRVREARAAREEGLPSTAEIVAREEVRRKLLEAVLALEEPYRRAVLLRYYEDLPPREVARRLGVPVETARTRVKRGLARLRAGLDERWEGDRRGWAMAVLPLTHGTWSAVGGAAGGGFAWKAAAALLALAVLGSAGFFAIQRGTGSAPSPRASDLAAADDPGGAGLRGAPGAVRSAAGTIRGTVTLEADEGEVVVEASRVGSVDLLDPRRRLENALAMLSPPLGGDVAARSEVGVDGTFRLAGLPRGVYLVTARAPDGHARVAIAALPSDHAETEVALDLRRGDHVLEGHVRRPDGGPSEGWIYVQPGPDRPSDALTLTWPRGTAPRRLDGDGGFRFEHLAAGPVALVVVEPGIRLLRRAGLSVPSAEPLSITMGGAVRKQARVVDAGSGAGIAGARLFAFAMLGGDASVFLETARTDAEGRAEIQDVGGRLHALVVADGYAPAQLRWPPDEVEPTVVMERLGTVAGRVADEAGRPLAGAIVHAVSFDESKPAREAATHADGRFRLAGVPPGEVMVFVHGGGYTSAELTRVDRDGYNPFLHELAPDASIEVELVATPAGAVEGRVCDDDGMGVAGVRVGLRGEPWPEARGPGFGFLLESPTTDEEGDFTLDTVLPGDALQVAALLPDGTRIESEPFSLAGGERRQVSLGGKGISFLDVHVEDERGAPVAGAKVFLTRRAADGHRVHRQGGPAPVSDANGEARVGPLSPTDLAVLVRSDAYLEGEPVAIEAAQREGRAPITVVLHRGTTLRGRVRGPSGLDLTTAIVDLVEAGSTLRSIEADASGAFRFDRLPPGDYEIEASAAHDGHGWKGRTRVEDPSREIEVDLLRGPRLEKPAPRPDPTLLWTIEVRGPKGGTIRKVSHRDYFRFPGGAWTYSGYGRGGGPIRVRTHPAGTDELYVEVFAAADGQDRSLPCGAALIRPEDLPDGGGTLTVTLPPERRVRGRLVGPDGRALAGVPVSAFARYEREGLPVATHDPHSTTRSRADGSFELRQLGSFSYVLRLDLPDAYAPHEDVAVVAGDEGVVIQVREGASMDVRVTDEKGRGVAGASVQLDLEGRAVKQGTTDGRGRYTAGGLDPRVRYGLRVHDAAQGKRYLARAMEPRTPGEVEVRLETAHTISGVIVAPDGRPLPHARVYRQTGPGGWETRYADEEGRFTLEGLAAGAHVLRVAPSLYFRWFEGTQHEVAAPASDLRLEASLGSSISFTLADDVLPSDVTVLVTDQDDPTRVGRFHAQSFREREQTIYGLDPTRRYVLYAVGAGRVFHATDLRPGEGVVAVELAPWRTILVTLDLPGGLPEGLGWENASVSAEGPGWRQYGRLVDPEGPTWEIPALPPGPCSVVAKLERWVRVSPDPSVPPERVGDAYEAAAEARSGEELRLTLHPIRD